MGRILPDVTDAELALLEVLWDRGPAATRDLALALYPPGGPSEAATVLKLLERLEQKGFVRREKVEGRNRFEAAAGRDALVGLGLRAVAERLCGGSMAPLLTTLVQGGALSEDERRQLRELLDAPPPPKRRPGRGGSRR
jgi:predicted transcriptional regulator